MNNIEQLVDDMENLPHIKLHTINIKLRGELKINKRILSVLKYALIKQMKKDDRYIVEEDDIDSYRNYRIMYNGVGILPVQLPQGYIREFQNTDFSNVNIDEVFNDYTNLPHYDLWDINTLIINGTPEIQYELTKKKYYMLGELKKDNRYSIEEIVNKNEIIYYITYRNISRIMKTIIPTDVLNKIKEELTNN